MPVDYNDPGFLKFMTENIMKTQKKRLQWFTKNMDTLTKTAKFPENYKGIRTTDVLKANLKITLPGFVQDYQNSMVNRRRKPVQDHELLKSFSVSDTNRTDSVPNSVMLPVVPSDKIILKTRLPYGGRKQYLKARNRLNPEEKYLFDETTNNVYGWKQSESHFSNQHPQFGHYSVFVHDLNSRTLMPNVPDGGMLCKSLEKMSYQFLKHMKQN